MFDLFRSRAKAVRYLLGGLLLLVALSMVITLIPGFGSSTGRNDEQVVAEIGGDKIMVQDVNEIIQQFTRQRQVPQEMLPVYIPEIVNQMVQDRAVVYQAERMGMRVPDSEVVNAIQESFPNFFTNGQLVNKQAFEDYLAQQGKTVQDLINDLRRQMLLVNMQNIVLEGIVVTPAEVEREMKRRGEKLEVAYISFSSDKFLSQVKVTPEELKEFYDRNKNDYRTPEKRGFQLLVADAAKMEESITIPDAQLRAAYNARRDQYRTPERVHVRHILLTTTGKTPEERKKIDAQAEDILKQLKNGADFAELATKYSQDPGSASKGGDLGWIVRGQTVKNFEDAAFSLKPKELSGVIKTEYGDHIIQVLEKQQAHVQSFEEVKDQLAKELKKQEVYDKMQNGMDAARAALVKNPSQVDQIAKQYGLESGSVAKAAPGDPIPIVGTSPELDQALAGLPKGGVTPVIQLPANRLMVAVVTDVFPSHPSDFAEVESKVRERVIDQKAQALAQEKANQAIETLKKSPGDFDKLAKSLGLTVSTTPQFGHNESIEGIGSSAYFEDYFDKPVGTIIGPLPLAGRTLVCKVVESVQADPQQFAKDRNDIVFALKQQKANERRDLFYDSIVSALIREGKVKIHQDAIKRLISSYRS